MTKVPSSHRQQNERCIEGRQSVLERSPADVKRLLSVTLITTGDSSLQQDEPSNAVLEHGLQYNSLSNYPIMKFENAMQCKMNKCKLSYNVVFVKVVYASVQLLCDILRVQLVHLLTFYLFKLWHIHPFLHMQLEEINSYTFTARCQSSAYIRIPNHECMVNRI